MKNEKQEIPIENAQKLLCSYGKNKQKLELKIMKVTNCTQINTMCLHVKDSCTIMSRKLYLV